MGENLKVPKNYSKDFIYRWVDSKQLRKAKRAGLRVMKKRCEFLGLALCRRKSHE